MTSQTTQPIYNFKQQPVEYQQFEYLSNNNASYIGGQFSMAHKQISGQNASISGQQISISQQQVFLMMKKIFK